MTEILITARDIEKLDVAVEGAIRVRRSLSRITTSLHKAFKATPLRSEEVERKLTSVKQQLRRKPARV